MLSLISASHERAPHGHFSWLGRPELERCGSSRFSHQFNYTCTWCFDFYIEEVLSFKQFLLLFLTSGLEERHHELADAVLDTD